MAKQKKKEVPAESLVSTPAAQATSDKPAGPPSSMRPPAAPPSSDDDDDDAVLNLGALVGASIAPPSAANDAQPDDDDDDDAKLDLSAMASSMAPSAMAAAATVSADAAPGAEAKATTKSAEAPSAAAKSAAAKSAAAKSAETKSSKLASKSEPLAVVAQPVASGEKPKSNVMLMGIAAVAVVVVGGFFFLRNGEPSAEETLAADHEGAMIGTAGSPATIGAPPGESNTAPSAGIAAGGTQAAEGAAPTEAVPASAVGTGPVAIAEAAQPAGAPPAEPAGPAARPRIVPRAGAPAAAASETAVVAAPVAAVPAVTPPAVGTGGRTSRGTTQAAVGAEPAVGTAAAGGEMNSLLDRALGGRPVAGGTRTEAGTAARPAVSAGAAAAIAPPVAAGPVPPLPSRGDIARAMGALLPGVRLCAGDQVGLATATVALKNDGTVVSASVAGVPFGGTPQGACMEGVIRRARFAPFTATTHRFTYPLAIR